MLTNLSHVVPARPARVGVPVHVVHVVALPGCGGVPGPPRATWRVSARCDAKIKSKKRSTEKRPGVPCGWQFGLCTGPEKKPQKLQIRANCGVACPRNFCKLVTVAAFGGKRESRGEAAGWGKHAGALRGGPLPARRGGHGGAHPARWYMSMRRAMHKGRDRFPALVRSVRCSAYSACTRWKGLLPMSASNPSQSPSPLVRSTT